MGRHAHDPRPETVDRLRVAYQIARTVADAESPACSSPPGTSMPEQAV
jgi:hypothetical protein